MWGFCGDSRSSKGIFRAIQAHWKIFSDSSNGCKFALKVNACVYKDTGAYLVVAEPTGLEPATSDVTGRRSNQLNYDSAKQIRLNFQTRQAARDW